jgi:hypothetical protein
MVCVGRSCAGKNVGGRSDEEQRIGTGDEALQKGMMDRKAHDRKERRRGRRSDGGEI